MATRGASALRRMEINRAALSEITLGVADGLFELGKSILADANVPDAPPYGQGLVEGGGVIVYVKGGTGTAKKVASTTIGGKQIRKPRQARIAIGATALVGYGFPGRFVELGTIATPAQPFLSPALASNLADMGPTIKDACIRRRATAPGGSRPRS